MPTTAPPIAACALAMFRPIFATTWSDVNLLPLFRQHDRRQFRDFLLLPTCRVPTSVTDRFQGYADVWRNIAGLTDEQLAQLIREDRIDILVDLTLHMAHNRLLVFARKPAPVQVTFAGYPGTTGLSTIDYRLTDPYLDPPGLNDRRYAEESIRLPDTFWCYDPLERRTGRQRPARRWRRATHLRLPQQLLQGQRLRS